MTKQAWCNGSTTDSKSVNEGSNPSACAQDRRLSLGNSVTPLSGIAGSPVLPRSFKKAMRAVKGEAE